MFCFKMERHKILVLYMFLFIITPWQYNENHKIKNLN